MPSADWRACRELERRTGDESLCWQIRSSQERVFRHLKCCRAGIGALWAMSLSPAYGESRRECTSQTGVCAGYLSLVAGCRAPREAEVFARILSGNRHHDKQAIRLLNGRLRRVGGRRGVGPHPPDPPPSGRCGDLSGRGLSLAPAPQGRGSRVRVGLCGSADSGTPGHPTPTLEGRLDCAHRGEDPRGGRHSGAYPKAGGFAVRPPGPQRAPSVCAPYREVIELALARGRSATAIWLDLISDPAYTARDASTGAICTRSPSAASVAP